MQLKTLKPGRRAFLSLAVVLTLAPIGVGVRQLITPEAERTAATIGDLANNYEGFLWSNRAEDFQNVPALLTVSNRVRTRFTGTFAVAPDIQIPVTGGVSNSGRIVINGSVNQSGVRVRADLTGQLSAGGNAIVGTYSVTGRDADGPINDRGSVALLIDAPNKD